MVKKKQPTQLQIEYRKARRNLQARVRRLEKKGVMVEPIPAIPKRITRGSINRLNKLTRKKLKETKVTIKFDVETGEILEEITRTKRKKKAEKHSELTAETETPEYISYDRITDIIITNVMSELSSVKSYISRPEARNNVDKIEHTINSLISQYGKREVATALNKANAEDKITLPLMYDDEATARFLIDIMSFLSEIGAEFAEIEYDNIINEFESI
jgi:hypothetical protein